MNPFLILIHTGKVIHPRFYDLIEQLIVYEKLKKERQWWGWGWGQLEAFPERY